MERNQRDFERSKELLENLSNEVKNENTCVIAATISGVIIRGDRTEVAFTLDTIIEQLIAMDRPDIQLMLMIEYERIKKYLGE